MSTISTYEFFLYRSSRSLLEKCTKSSPWIFFKMFSIMKTQPTGSTSAIMRSITRSRNLWIKFLIVLNIQRYDKVFINHSTREPQMLSESILQRSFLFTQISRHGIRALFQICWNSGLFVLMMGISRNSSMRSTASFKYSPIPAMCSP